MVYDMMIFAKKKTYFNILIFGTPAMHIVPGYPSQHPDTVQTVLDNGVVESGPTSSVSLVHTDGLVEAELVDDLRAAVLAGLHQGGLQVSVSQVDVDAGRVQEEIQQLQIFLLNCKEQS